MKRKFTLALLLVFCLTALLTAFGCQPSGPKPDSSTDDVVIGSPAGLNDAKDVLEATFGEKDPSTVVDYNLPSQVYIGGEGFYPVVWSVTEGVGINVIQGEGEVDTVIDVPVESATDINYTLTGVISASDDSTATISFNFTVPACIISTWEEYKAACEEASKDVVINVKGYVIAVNADGANSKSKGSLWLVDADGNGYYAYKPALSDELTKALDEAEGADAKRAVINNEYPLGAEVIATGTATVHGGAYELNSGCTLRKTGNSIDPKTIPYHNYQEVFANGKKADLIAAQATRGTVEILMSNPDSKGNYYFFVNGKEYVCYSNIYLMNEAEDAAFEAKWKPGKFATLSGIVTSYSNVYQIYPESAASLTVLDKTVTDAEKVDLEGSFLSFPSAFIANASISVASQGTMFSDVSIAWTSSDATVAAYADGEVNVTAPAEYKEIKVTATVTCGEASKEIVFDVAAALPAQKLPVVEAEVQLVKDAYALEKDATIADAVLSGVICEIDSAYSSEFSNISVVIAVPGADETMLCYRMKGAGADTLKVGDCITVSGTIKNYNGTIEFDYGCTFVSYGYVKPEAVEVENIAEALALGDGTGVIVSGIVTSIGYAWKEGSMSLTISDSANSLYIYKLATEVALNDIITVTGEMATFSGSRQIGAGATAEITGKHEACVDSDNNYKCDACGKILEHTCVDADSDTNCDICGKYVAPAGSTEVRVTYAVPTIATSVEISELTVDDVITLKFAIGHRTNKPLHHTSGQVRLYSGTMDVVAAEGYVIKEIKVTWEANSGTTTFTCENGNSAELVWTGSESSVQYKTGPDDASNGHIRIKSVEIVYDVAPQA